MAVHLLTQTIKCFSKKQASRLRVQRRALWGSHSSHSVRERWLGVGLWQSRRLLLLRGCPWMRWHDSGVGEWQGGLWWAPGQSGAASSSLSHCDAASVRVARRADAVLAGLWRRLWAPGLRGPPGAPRACVESCWCEALWQTPVTSGTHSLRASHWPSWAAALLSWRF